MEVANTYQSKTKYYLKVKKPLLERQRRARINQCLESLRQLVTTLQTDDGVLRMDKAELLEATVDCLRQQHNQRPTMNGADTASFRNGYMNAVGEVSRVMASTPGMTVQMGKSVMTHLGRCYNKMQQHAQQQHMQALSVECAPPSPASSGYCSDYESPMNSPVALQKQSLWRPW